jgi:hypothetical protein
VGRAHSPAGGLAVAAHDQDWRDNAQAALRGLDQRAAGLLGAAATATGPVIDLAEDQHFRASRCHRRSAVADVVTA